MELRNAMAKYQGRAILTSANVTGIPSVAEAEAAVRADLQSRVPAWTVERVQLQVVHEVGEWVSAERQAGRQEYARVVAGTTALQVEFADGQRRALRPEMVRV